MRLFTLTPRLGKIADLVPRGHKVWDVGTDHGKLVVWLLLKGHIVEAIASDIGDGPLNSARRTAKHYGVEDEIEFICCNGLNTPTPHKADTVTIAGMGGDTVISILQEANMADISSAKLILQPMTAIEELRTYLYSGSYTVHEEYVVAERGRLYTVIAASFGGAPEEYDLADTRVGKYTVRSEHYPQYMLNEIERLKKELLGTRIPRHIILDAINKLEESHV